MCRTFKKYRRQEIPMSHISLRTINEEHATLTMKLLHDLLFTDYGLMSLIGILLMLGMAVFFVRLFLNKI